MNSLTVIIPAYNVDEYINECIDSIQAQSDKTLDLRIILIDDGSTDDTKAIMEEYSKSYDNIEYYHFDNQGPSACRNFGIKLATSEYITFVDGDDIVPANAYKNMMATIAATQSDMVIGTVRRFDSFGSKRSWLHKKGIKYFVTKTDINRYPSLVYDTTSWNKIYRRSIIAENNIIFPVGKISEDIPFVMHMHLASKSVDIVDVLAYQWRLRDGSNKSLTQVRNTIQPYRDRLDTIQMTIDLMSHYQVSNAVINELHKKLLDIDIPLFSDHLFEFTIEEVIEFRKLTLQFLKKNKIDLDLIKTLSAEKQIMFSLLEQNKLNQLVSYISRNTKELVFLNKKDQNYHLKSPKWDKLVDLSSSIESRTQIQNVEINSTGKGFIEGYFNPYKLRIKRRTELFFSAYFLNPVNNAKIEVPIEKVVKNGFKRHANFAGTHKICRRKKWQSFRIKFDLQELKQKLGEGPWLPFLTAKAKNLNFSCPVGNPISSADKKFVRIKEKYYSYGFGYDWQLAISQVKEWHQIVDAKLYDDSIAFKIKSIGAEIKQVQLVDDDSNRIIVLSKDEKDSFVYKSALSELEENRSFSLALIDDTSSHMDGIGDYNVEIGSKLVNVQEKSIKLSATPTSVTISPLPASVYPSSITVNNETVEITFPNREIDRLYPNHYLLLKDENTGQQVRCYKNRQDEQIVFEVELKSSLNKPFLKGKYTVFLVDEDNQQLHPVFKSVSLHSEIDKINQIDIVSDEVGQVFIQKTIKWGFFDRSVIQRRINFSIIYPLMRFLPLKNCVVFDSYWADKYNCSPKAIYDYLQEHYPSMHCVWFFKDMNIPIDGTGERVRYFSLKYWYYLAVSKYLIQNTNFPAQYAKRKGQIEVETLHGTFMKTMGFDEPHFKYASKRKQRSFQKRINRWDYLVSPSPFMTKTASNAFDYKGKVLEVGFPRNDRLYHDNTPEKIQQIKTQLGIDQDKKVILYAPTYRNKSGFDFKLDIDRLSETIGDEYVLLVRLHYFIADQLDLSGYSSFAYDVSQFNSIEDLYLVTNVLITDYSSVMFDFGHLKRPMIFFAYDLDDYTKKSRGVYLNFEKVVPGPIVSCTDEMINYLIDFESFIVNYKSKIDDFYQKFCTFGRGDSSEKVVEAMLNNSVKQEKSEPLIRNKIKRIVKYNKWYPKFFALVGRKLSKKDTIVFESFFGRNYSDNPKALYEYAKNKYPGYKLYWNVNKEYVEYFKMNKIPYLIRFSFLGALTQARAKYWILNTRLPLWQNKPKGTKVIQTWHGTPLKRLGLDIGHVTMPGVTTDAYHKQVVKDSNKWDYLIAPNQYSADIFKSCFCIREKQLIKSGYPRNDVLFNYSEDDRAKIKTDLGIDHQQKIILYAPTWRDDEYKRIDNYTASIHLDLGKIKEKFGEDVLILIRVHYLIANSLDLSSYKNIALDVSNYQDISKLYIISDILITDYSSVFFDYANLKRPIIFFAYDIEKYKSETRGFYFDYYSELPGNIVTTTEGVIEEIEKSLVSHQQHPNYDKFLQKYCEWETGLAAQKVFEFLEKEIPEF